jgi:hypothetical protein
MIPLRRAPLSYESKLYVKMHDWRSLKAHDSHEEKHRLTKLITTMILLLYLSLHTCVLTSNRRKHVDKNRAR